MTPDAKRDSTPRKKAVGAFWSGTISFGLISVPVQLFPANRRSSVSLRMLDQDGTPLRRRYYCPKHERLVEPAEIVRGHEIDDGDHVIVTDEELEAVSPGKSREIDLKRFVETSQIPPLFFQRAYFLTPTGDSNKAYRLLADVMERTDRAGIASFVMRNREYLVAIIAEDGILRAETLRFQDEIRTPEAVGLADDPELDDELVERYGKAIEGQTTDGLDLDEMKDDSGEALRSLVERRRKKGEGVVEVPGRSGEGAANGDRDVADGDGDAEEGEFAEIDLLETIRISLKSGNGVT